MTIQSPNPRAEIVRLIGVNRDNVEPRLIAIWHAFVEDFIVAGLDRRRVAETIFTAAAMHLLKAEGTDATVEYLRGLAAVLERDTDARPAEPERRH